MLYLAGSTAHQGMQNKSRKFVTIKILWLFSYEMLLHQYYRSLQTLIADVHSCWFSLLHVLKVLLTENNFALCVQESCMTI